LTPGDDRPASNIDVVRVDEVPATRNASGCCSPARAIRQHPDPQGDGGHRSYASPPAVLVDLAERGPTSQQSLLETLSVDPSVMVSILNDLERQGLAERAAIRPTGGHIVEMSARAARSCAASKSGVDG